MTETTSNPGGEDIAEDRDTRATARGGLLAVLRRVSTKARWRISVALGLAAPALLITDSAAGQFAEKIVCVANGSVLALAASANAFAMIP